MFLVTTSTYSPQFELTTLTSTEHILKGLRPIRHFAAQPKLGDYLELSAHYYCDSGWGLEGTLQKDKPYEVCKLSGVLSYSYKNASLFSRTGQAFHPFILTKKHP